MAREAGRPLPGPLQELVLDALTAFYEKPETRSRSYWAFKGCMGYWTYSLLGMLCALNGSDFLHDSRTRHNVLCRAFLKELGFSNYDVLALQEINDHTSDLEVLQIRVERYMETGERMPFPVDDLHDLDMERKADA
jgi:hypothetical protein